MRYKEKTGVNVKRIRLPITMPISANMCCLLHSFVFGYINSIMLAAACVAAFFVIFMMWRIHNFESV